jgi:pentapeptide MXKDX repeat protein
VHFYRQIIEHKCLQKDSHRQPALQLQVCLHARPQVSTVLRSGVEVKNVETQNFKRQDVEVKNVERQNAKRKNVERKILKDRLSKGRMSKVRMSKDRMSKGRLSKDRLLKGRLSKDRLSIFEPMSSVSRRMQWPLTNTKCFFHKWVLLSIYGKFFSKAFISRVT